MAPVLESPDRPEPLAPPDPHATPVGATPHGVPPQGPSTGEIGDGAEPPPRRTGWHIAAIVIGALMLLPGFGAAAVGTGLLVAQSTATDDGFFDRTIDQVRTDGVAIATIDLWDVADYDDRPIVLDWLDIDIRLWVEGAGDTDEVFVGIARSEDVATYLDGSMHSEVTDVDDLTPEYLERSGSTSIAAPDTVEIWDASVAGTGEQELTWEARGGSWSVVVMNVDGSPGVAAEVKVGVRSDAITPIGVSMIVFGGLVLIAGAVLIVIGVRGRRGE